MDTPTALACPSTPSTPALAPRVRRAADAGAPPVLGEAPGGSRWGALALSLPAYGAFVAAAVLFTTVRREAPAPRQTVALSLAVDDLAPPPPPPPPPPPAGGAPGAAPRMREPEIPTALRSRESLPELQPMLPRESALPSPSAAPAHPGGLPGGQPGGVSGGVPGGVPGGQVGGELGGQLGGQIGGHLGGHLGGVVPPRFDAAYLQNPAPDYPSLSRTLGEEGRVLLRVLVNPDGHAARLEIRTGSGFPRLDQAALDTVRRWRFVAARRGSEAVAAWVLIPITFKLDA